MTDAFDPDAVFLMWEKTRKVRKLALNSPTMLTIPLSAITNIIEEDMKCPICLGTIDTTSSVTTCLHRFCSKCLERSLRVDLGPKGHHDCPACRAKMASRRSSKRDVRFDNLITVLSVAAGKRPRSALDALVHEEGDDLHDEDNMLTSSRVSRRGHSNHGDMMEDGNHMDDMMGLEDFNANKYRKAHLEKVAQFRKRREAILKAKPAPLRSSSTAPIGSSKGNQNVKEKKAAGKALSAANKTRDNGPGPRVCLALFPSAEGKLGSRLMSLSMPFLKVPPIMQIGDVKQFLNLKFSFTKEEFSLLEIFIIDQNKKVILDDLLTISDVLMLYWDAKSELQLYYRFYPVEDTEPSQS